MGVERTSIVVQVQSQPTISASHMSTRAEHMPFYFPFRPVLLHQESNPRRPKCLDSDTHTHERWSRRSRLLPSAWGSPSCYSHLFGYETSMGESPFSSLSLLLFSFAFQVKKCTVHWALALPYSKAWMSAIKPFKWSQQVLLCCWAHPGHSRLVLFFFFPKGMNGLPETESIHTSDLI